LRTVIRLVLHGWLAVRFCVMSRVEAAEPWIDGSGNDPMKKGSCRSKKEEAIRRR